MRQVLVQKERGLFHIPALGEWWTRVSKTTTPRPPPPPASCSCSAVLNSDSEGRTLFYPIILLAFVAFGTNSFIVLALGRLGPIHLYFWLLALGHCPFIFRHALCKNHPLCHLGQWEKLPSAPSLPMVEGVGGGARRSRPQEAWRCCCTAPRPR